MKGRTFYEIFGIQRDANNDTIVKSYRELALCWHPDRGPSEESEQRKEIVHFIVFKLKF